MKFVQSWLGVLVFCAVLVISLWGNVSAQSGHSHQGNSPQSGHESGEEAPIRITMEELHRLGGSPRGWRFRVPQGDPSEGRKVYLKLECFSCHAVQGEDFPAPDEEEKKKGPDLTGMGKHHSEEYLFESIVNPNRVIVEAPGYTGTDGLSIMPDYNHLLTIEEAVNLVAYVKSLKGKALHHGSDHGKGTHHKSK